jgi:hypothetical protein
MTALGGIENVKLFRKTLSQVIYNFSKIHSALKVLVHLKRGSHRNFHECNKDYLGERIFPLFVSTQKWKARL